MPDETRTIFRREAMWRVVHGQDKAVLPRFIRPRTFLCLWILLGLLSLAAALVWAAQVPVYASGVAVVSGSQGELKLAVLVPSESFEKLRVGQTVWVRWPAAREPARTRITRIEPKIQSPAEVRERFGLSSETVSRAMIVATADPQGGLPATNGLSPETHRGSTATADVEIGSRRVWSLLPILDER